MLWRPYEERAGNAPGVGDDAARVRGGGGGFDEASGGAEESTSRPNVSAVTRAERKILGVPDVFAFAVRDVRVEFPYQASVCPGDMEYDDVIQWLRRFRSSVEGEESTQGVVGDVLIEQPSGEDVKVGGIAAESSGGADAAELKDGAKLRPTSQHTDVPAPASTSDEASSGRRVPWACQYVEAREFDLTVAISSGGDSVAVADSGETSTGVVPHLNCAISGVSVSTAAYSHNGKRCFVSDCCGGGGSRGRGANPDATKKASPPTPTPQSPSGAFAPSRSTTAQQVEESSSRGNRGGEGDLFPGSGGRRKFEPSASWSSSSRFYVSLGGTRHCPSSRKR